MIAVNVGDVIDVRGGGVSFQVVRRAGSVTEDGKQRYMIVCEPCAPPSLNPATKFHYREVFNGYEREFGAETLLELYALMAAAGVKFQTVYPTVTEKGTYITAGNVSPTCKVEAILNTPMSSAVRKYPSAFNDTLGAVTINEVRTHRDDTDPQPTVVGS